MTEGCLQRTVSQDPTGCEDILGRITRHGRGGAVSQEMRIDRFTKGSSEIRVTAYKPMISKDPSLKLQRSCKRVQRILIDRRKHRIVGEARSEAWVLGQDKLYWAPIFGLRVRNMTIPLSCVLREVNSKREVCDVTPTKRAMRKNT